jgi:hypothetical protein
MKRPKSKCSKRDEFAVRTASLAFARMPRAAAREASLIWKFEFGVCFEFRYSDFGFMSEELIMGK